MPDKTILDYISKNLSVGYDVNAIRQSLRQSGYSEKQINAAFDFLNAQRQYGSQAAASYTPGGHVSHKKVLQFGIIGVIGIGFLLIFLTIFFTFDGEEPTPRSQRAIPTPDLQPVQERETQTPQIEEPVEPVAEPVIGDPVELSFTDAPLTRLEVDSLVDQLLPDQPAKAAKLCEEIVTKSGRSSCLAKVAFESKDEQYCGFINDAKVRDTCYINFAINEVGSIQEVCPHILNEYKQRSCVELYNNFAELHAAQQIVASDEPLPEVTLNREEEKIVAFGTT